MHNASVFKHCSVPHIVEWLEFLPLIVTIVAMFSLNSASQTYFTTVNFTNSLCFTFVFLSVYYLGWRSTSTIIYYSCKSHKSLSYMYNTKIRTKLCSEAINGFRWCWHGNRVKSVFQWFAMLYYQLSTIKKWTYMLTSPLLMYPTKWIFSFYNPTLGKIDIAMKQIFSWICMHNFSA